MKKRLLILVNILLISMLIIVPASAVPCSLNLPETSVILASTYIGPESTFISTLSGVPSGYDVENKDYLGWCVDLTHDAYPSGSLYVKLLSSCNIPSEYTQVWAAEHWDKVNYILNNKPEVINSGDVLDIQMAIWNFVDNIPGEGDNDPYHDPSPDCIALIEAANTYGDGFVPSAGGIIAVICVNTVNQQLTIIEVDVPEDDNYEGLTPGFWKNHVNVWPSGYSTDTLFSDLFGVTGTTYDDLTLLEALNAKGGVVEKKDVYDALVRHSVAAVLNAAHSNVNYPMTVGDIVTAVFETMTNTDLTDAEPLKNILCSNNAMGGGIDAHGNPI